MYSFPRSRRIGVTALISLNTTYQSMLVLALALALALASCPRDCSLLISASPLGTNNEPTNIHWNFFALHIYIYIYVNALNITTTKFPVIFFF
jgi:hypothetical protein